jgi:hypothetical protein
VPYPELRRWILVTGALLLAPARVFATPTDDTDPDWRLRLERLGQLLSADQAVDQLVSAHMVAIGSGSASVTFDYQDGGAITLSLADDQLRIDGRHVGRVPAGGAFETAWLRMALDASRLETPAALALLEHWQPEGTSREEEALVALVRNRLAGLSAPGGSQAVPLPVAPAAPGGLTIDLSDLSEPSRLAPMLRAAARLQGEALRITVPGGRVQQGQFGVGSAERIPGHLLVVRGDADVYGTVAGNLATVEGDVIVHPGAVVLGDVLAVAGQVKDLGGDIRGQIRTLDPPHHLSQASERGGAPSTPAWIRALRNAAGVAGVFFTLMLVGIGLVLFVRQPLEVVSDTVLHSFGRALMVGLLGQVLVLPTFGMLVVGLVLSVAGILLVPFAVIVFALLLVLAILGGFLAVAHAMGESLTRRQLAQGAAIASANSYRYVIVGLAGVLALWLGWVAFGWVPVAGTLVLATAVLITWLLGTVGFGAALLSRAGFREHFAGRLLPAEALTDEYLWATPQFGVTAVKRPPRDRGTTPLP